MSKTLTVSDETAALLEARRRSEGKSSIDETAEILIVRGLAADEGDLMAGRTVDELRALIAEGRDGPTEPWSAAEVRAEVLRRYTARKTT